MTCIAAHRRIFGSFALSDLCAPPVNSVAPAVLQIFRFGGQFSHAALFSAGRRIDAQSCY